MTRKVSRRRFMRASVAAAATSVGLAGCLGTDESLTPSVPEKRLQENGWEHTEDIENQINQTITLASTEQEVSVRYKGTIWENDRHLSELPVDADGAANVASMRFGAGKATTEPNMGRLLNSTDAAVEEIISQAEKRVRDRIAEQPHVENFRRVKEDVVDTIHEGEEAQRFIYRFDVKYESFETSINGQQVTIEAGTFTVETQVLIWVHNGVLAVAGGGYPGEQGTVTATTERNGKTRSREIEMGFAPDDYREHITELARRLD